MGTLFEEMSAYIAAGRSRFHTPGHAGKAAALLPFSPLLPYDLTEVEGLDSLYHADGVLQACEDRAAALFGSRGSFLSAGGCSQAIKAMLSLAVPPGGRVAMGRNAHFSAVSAAGLIGFEPVWLYPGSSGVVEPATIEAALCNTSVDAVYLTSPDYYGRLCDIAAIAAVCRRFGTPLLVDNAHGSHLRFLPEDRHPLSLGADMTACSLHKTLPVLTGGALLNIGNETYISDARERMALFGSTSPSYLIMGSLDLCFDWLERGGKAAFDRLEARAKALREFAWRLGFSLPEGRQDPVRFTLPLAENGIAADDARAAFRPDCMWEYCDPAAMVFLLHPFHEEADFARLKEGLSRLRPRIGSKKMGDPSALPRAEAILPVREALFAPAEILPLHRASGRIAAELVCPCPPGIPVAVPGERLEGEILSLLQETGWAQVRVVRT
ncbi:MAG: DegT/DnrJ/EryC1/StrS family aminotransferase [Candidatus Howiella sp.]|jgi:arginine decarboxylase